MDKQTEYWLGESWESFDVAKVLYKSRKFLESAFFCHLSMEKMLKSLYSQKKQETPPKIHNLLSLVQQAELLEELSKDQLDFLAELNSYQLEGRYPASRERLYQTTSEDEFKNVLKQTEEGLNWLKQKLKSKK